MHKNGNTTEYFFRFCERHERHCDPFLLARSKRAKLSNFESEYRKKEMKYEKTTDSPGVVRKEL